MLLIVHTITMTLGGLEVNALSFHGVRLKRSGLKLSLLGRRFAVKRLKNKGWSKKPTYKHRLKAFGYRPLDTPKLIETKENRNFCRAGFRQVLANSPSTSREEAKPQLDLQTPPNSPKQGYEVGNGTSQYDCVNASWGPQQVALWLTLNRYGSHIHHTLSTYSGADLLRLSKDDLIQLCGLSDGIRLHNAIHSKCIIPKLTLYVCINQKEQVYQVIYLKTLTKLELLVKICQILKIDQVQVSSAYLQGPNGIKVLMTDQLIKHIPDHTLFTIHLSHDGPDRYELLCKESEIKSPP